MKQLVARLSKLRKMSLREIQGRANALIHQRRERWRYRRGTVAPPLDGMPPTAELLARCRALLPGSSSTELQGLAAESPMLAESLRCRSAARVQSLQSGNYEMLGFAYDLRGEIDWQRDPRTDYRWESKFYADLPLRGVSGSVDVKYVWELGRMQYVAELSRAWLLEGDHRAASRARDLISSWIASNPWCEGIHWTSGLELAMRSISWIWTLAALADWDGWEAGELEEIAASLADHANYLEDHLSFFSSPYNHLIGEATALMLIGQLLRPFPQAAQWEALGREVLTEYGPEQFYDDGFCVEQATGYHFYTLGFMLMALHAGRQQNRPLADLEPVVHRAFLAGRVLMRPDGRWPAIGDVDSARSMPVVYDDYWNFRPLVSLAAVMFHDAELKAAAGEPGEELFWLRGRQGLEQWDRLERAPLEGNSLLNDSGYAVARWGDDWMLLDGGPIAHGLHPDRTPSTAHGHADALQVLYYTGDHDVLVDPGMPFYFGDRTWTDHFRGAAAHNTLVVDGVSMARSVGQLEWSCVAERPDLDAAMIDGAWMARARARWHDDMRIERFVCGLPGVGMFIADWLHLDRVRRIQWFWQLPEGRLEMVERPEVGRWVAHGESVSMAAWADSLPIRARLQRARKEGPDAWHARGYGTIRAAQRLCQEAESCEILTVTFVGPQLVPCRVQLPRRRLVCPVEGQPVEFDNIEDPATGIIWSIATPKGPRTIRWNVESSRSEPAVARSAT